MTVHHEVLRALYTEIGTRPAECGGVLGGNAESGAVNRFWFDEGSRRSCATYAPDVERVNRVVDEVWASEGVQFLGFVHSHPGSLRRPSHGDETYIRAILRERESLDRLLVPIILPEADGTDYELWFWVAERSGRGVELRLAPVQAVDDAGRTVQVDRRGQLIASPAPTRRARAVAASVHAALSAHEPVTVADAFSRVEAAYDLSRLARSRVVFIGVGGMRETVGQVARSGVEEFILIDPGKYEAANIGTQPCFRDEIGVAKVDAVKAEIARINPNARVVALACSTDELDDNEFGRLLHDPMLRVPVPGRAGRTTIDVRPEAVVLVGGTDDFFAQARVNRMGLHFGLPTMLSALYANGVGAELTWVHPAVSRCCHRCVLWPRYEAFLEEGYRNTVTSHGTPIFATQRISALEMLMLMALLHHDTDHPRFGAFLRRVGDRSLVQVRLDPEMSSLLGVLAFDRVFEHADRDRLLCDESVWLPQVPEDGTNGRRACPECGGAGDLRRCVGRLPDTRVMQR